MIKHPPFEHIGPNAANLIYSYLELKYILEHDILFKSTKDGVTTVFDGRDDIVIHNYDNILRHININNLTNTNSFMVPPEMDLYDNVIRPKKYFVIKEFGLSEESPISIFKNLTTSYNSSKKIIIDEPVTHLYFENAFNRHIIIPETVTHLMFGQEFNLPVIIPNSVKYLIFGNHFNKPVVIPNSVTHLQFGNQFNQYIVIPDSVIYLEFGEDFNKPITIPKSVIRLTFGQNFDSRIRFEISSSLTHLKFGNNFNQPFIVPGSVTHLKFGYRFHQPFNIPNFIVYLKFGSNLCQSMYFADPAKCLRYKKYFEKIVMIPESARYLDFACVSNFNKKLLVHSSIMKIENLHCRTNLKLFFDKNNEVMMEYSQNRDFRY